MDNVIVVSNQLEWQSEMKQSDTMQCMNKHMIRLKNDTTYASVLNTYVIYSYIYASQNSFFFVK